MDSGGNGDTPFTRINIIPFVDIVLVLLIIFMLTAPVLFETSIPLELPEAESVEPASDTDFGLIILADGSLVLDGASVTDAELRREIRENPGRRALLSADRSVLHGRVIEVIDLLRREGIQRYALNVIPSTHAD